jgi:hypothetical protein
MKITEICESTTSGSVATVAAPMNGGPLKRSTVGKGVYGKEPAGSLFTGKKTSKPFANSKLNEEGGFPGEKVTVIYVDGKSLGVKYANPEDADKALKILRKKYPNKKVEHKQEVKEAGMPAAVIKHKQKLTGMNDAELAEHLKDKSDDELKQMAWRHGYGKSSLHYVNRVNKGKKINENELQETDLIIGPGQGHRLKSGFISRAEDRRDHEVEMARSDLHQAHKNSSKIHKLIKNVSEDEGLEGWVQAKITKAADYLNSVCQYLEGKQLQEMTEARGGLGVPSTPTSRQEFANRFDYDSDYQATKYKPNKYDPETGLGGYVAPHVYNKRDESNIMIQLQKNINSNRASPLEFKDGSTLIIRPSTAIAALNKIASMKAAEKHETVKNLALSKNNFISFLNLGNLRKQHDVDQLEEGMGLKQLAAAAAAVGYMLVPSNAGDGEAPDTRTGVSMSSSELNRNRTRPPTHRNLDSFRQEFGQDWPHKGK